MAFKNAEIINLLRERGTAIKNEDWAEQTKCEEKINDLKNREFETLTTPCSVFMTFETEEGVNRALSYAEAVEESEDLKDLKYWIDTHELDL